MVTSIDLINQAPEVCAPFDTNGRTLLTAPGNEIMGNATH
jgi:hypothetical protein